MSDDVPPLPRIKHPKRMLALSDDEIPTPIILKDDLDFQATYDYVLNLRREIRDYLCPGTWQEIELKPIPVHRYVRVIDAILSFHCFRITYCLFISQESRIALSTTQFGAKLTTI